MHVEFSLEAQLRHLAKCDRLTLSLPTEASLLQGLQQLASERPALRDHILASPTQARPSLVMVVNDTPVHARVAGSYLLSEGDKVVLLPPISGG